MPLFCFLPAVGVISTEVTYILGGLVFAWIVEEWVWDYAITVTLLHIAMTVAGIYTHTRTQKHKVDQLSGTADRIGGLVM